MVLHVSVRVKSVLLVFMATAAVVAFFIIALANTKPSIRPVVLLTGDSHTQKGTNPAESGWVSLLQNQFVMTSDVITRGLPGYNTKWFSKFIAPSIKREIQAGVYNTPSLITVWFGSNDAALANGTSSKTHVSIEDFKENLKKVVRQFWTAAPAADILLITPPHVNDAARAELSAEKNGTIDRTNAMAKEYARACVEVADAVGVQVLDLNTFFNTMPESSRNELLQADGLHLNSKGNILVDEQLRRKIADKFPSLGNNLEVWQFPAASHYAEEDPWIANVDR
ncbi:GDSL-like Lipase/Acylhydrolase family [Phytophthora infestans]|uniref:GDSL-like Lipase/Acylhydrolase family n=1 Tax=Phytophthora infestans TaxID=4787 RepID=A0A833WPA1_PHYIN|nr:GDSL-like Lipase/Acylhydrolase family [Phytophthora infestans]KAF4127157.1 GDSL-like Lipase/Acylhydrolase family [Phytophthora infestans]